MVDEPPSGRPALLSNLRIREPGAYFATAGGGLGYALPAESGGAR